MLDIIGEQIFRSEIRLKKGSGSPMRAAALARGRS